MQGLKAKLFFLCVIGLFLATNYACETSKIPGCATDMDCRAPRICIEGKCTESTSEDQDGDGHKAAVYGGGDCNDNSSNVHPGATEIKCNNIDEDCDGIDYCLDNEGKIVTFEKTFPENSGASVQQTRDGGYILAGRNFSSKPYLPYVTKIDQQGNKQWDKVFKTLEGLNIDTSDADSIQQTLDSGYIISGSGSYPSQIQTKTFLIKINFEGDIQWDKILSENFGAGVPTSVQQTSDGGYIVVQTTATKISETSYTNTDIHIIKTDHTGHEQWNKRFAISTDFEYGMAVKQTSDEGYIVYGGGSDEYNHRFHYLIKTDSAGNEQWSRTFEGSDADDMDGTSDGGYILLGIQHGLDSPNESHLIKTDATGSPEWNKSIFCKCVGRAIRQISDEGYIVVGDDNSDLIHLIKINSIGDGQWSKTFGRDSYSKDVKQTRDGGYILLGNHLDPRGIYLVKTDPDGNLQLK